MQTQFQQGNKKNKVLVPFYTPPPRLYGPTPAEIIKEARAAVMPTPALGIKPVYTTRPFTPKDNERTLFGTFKRGQRYPTAYGDKSSCSPHSHSSSPDSSGQIKLPSIESASKRKNHTIFHYSNNLSLDNLTEDYDAEILEESKINVSAKLPAWKKSHSCPKEGRMVKAASYNEINDRLFFIKNTESHATMDDKNLQPSPKTCFEKRPGLATIYNESVSKEPVELRKNFYEFMDRSRGSGDHDKTVSLDANLLLESNMKSSSKAAHKGEKGDHFSKPKPSDNLQLKTTCSEQVSQSQRKNKKEETEFFNKQAPELKLDEFKLGTTERTEKVKETNEEEIATSRSNNDRTSSEKSIATEPKSEYLLKLKEGLKKSAKEESPVSIPQEIIELYQTAEYYGVNLNDTKVPEHSEPETEKVKSESKIDSKAVESTNIYKSSPVNSEVKGTSDAKKTFLGANRETENEQFPMNDKKRYHYVADKKQGEVKAYEKWKEKQKECFPPTPPKTDNQEGWNLFWENCYYKAKTIDDIRVEKKPEPENQFSTQGLSALLRLLNKSIELFKLGGDNSTIYDVNCQLYRLLRNGQISCDNDTKTKILKAVSLHSENEDPKVLLSLARLLFYLKLDSSLTTACKLIFNVAKFDSNDHLFLNEEDILELFMEGVGRASPLDNAESCIYGYGALKFLTMNYNILSRTLHMGALDLMTLHLKLINTACEENNGVGEQTQHALFQLTGVLRHIAAGEGALPLFITTNCIAVICKNLELFKKDEDIVTNISRTMSLVSTDESIIPVLMSVENILPLLVDLMERFKDNDKTLIRLSFCLGNIVEHSDLARIQLLRNDASLSTLLNLLKFYMDKDLALSLGRSVSNASGELDSEIIDDVIVKIIRIIANMSMNPIVGSNLSPAANEKKSLQLSRLLSVLLMRKDPGITLLAALGCLNNVSYYCNFHSALIDITQGIERVIGLESEDCQAEAARVLGNLTRHKEIRDLIFNTGGVNQLIKLLTSKDQEVVRCVCGALVNVLLDLESRKQFLESGGIDRLVDAMESFSGDWSLASLAGRAIWNSCADDMSSIATHNNLERILNTLATSLEEENWKDGDAAWEEFASIATDLLEKINSHLDSTQ